jgi:hypothetical protein
MLQYVFDNVRGFEDCARFFVVLLRGLFSMSEKGPLSIKA